MPQDPTKLTPAHHQAVTQVVQQRAGDILRHAAARLAAEQKPRATWGQAVTRLLQIAEEHTTQGVAVDRRGIAAELKNAGWDSAARWMLRRAKELGE